MFGAPAAVDDCNFNRFSSQTHGILLYQLPRACRLGYLGLFGFFGAAHECCQHVDDGEPLEADAVDSLGNGHFDVVGVGEGVDGGGGGDAFGDLAVGCLGGFFEGAALAESVAEGTVSGEG